MIGVCNYCGFIKLFLLIMDRFLNSGTYVGEVYFIWIFQNIPQRILF